MRWLAVLALLAAGCPAPPRYVVDRPGLDCDRAVRTSKRTLETLGYTITGLVEPQGPGTSGHVTGRKKMPDGKVTTGSVQIRCTTAGAELKPIEDALVPNFEFSRAFGYSFKSLVQGPEAEVPRVQAGVQPLVEAVDPFEQRLELGGEAVVAGSALIRLTIRNGTDRAVTIEPAGLVLVAAGGAETPALGSASTAAAITATAAGDHVRGQLLSRPVKVAAGATAIRYLVFPAGSYGEARVELEDVETGERDGTVTAVQ